MTAHVGIDGLTALRRIDPDEAALGSALCALLRAEELTVRIAGAEPLGAVFKTADGLAYTVATLGGRTPQLTAQRVSETVAALDAIDPLLATIEGALSVDLDAIGFEALDAASRIVVHAARGDDAVTLAILRDHPKRTEWIARAMTLRPSAPHMPVAVALAVEGPRLSVANASDLAPGDLLLMAQSAPATLSAPFLPAIAGAFDFASGTFSVGQTGAAMPDETASTPADFMVPLTIHLSDRMTSAASLAALAPGATLPLGPLTDGMPLELSVAGRRLARGELVQMGDRFAVLIEDRADIADAVVAPKAREEA